MLTKLLLTALLLPAVAGNPKITFNKKTNDVYVNGEKSFQVVNTGTGLYFGDWQSNVYDKDTARAIVVVLRTYNSRRNITPANPEGTVKYFEVLFMASGDRAEVASINTSHLGVAKYVVQQGLMKNGYLDEKAAEEFVFINGTSFSDRKCP